MRPFQIKKLHNVFVLGTLFLVQVALGQSQCLSDDSIQQMVVQLNSPQNTPHDEHLRNALKQLKAEYAKFYINATQETLNEDKLAQKIAAANPQNEITLCRIFRQYGWPTKSLVGNEGVSAALYLVKNSGSFQTQMQLLPIIALAVKKNEIEKNEDFASFIDRLRLQAGLKQLFGTQARVSDGFLVLAQLQSERKIDAWRQLYNMPPLAEYIKFLENTFKMPLIKSSVLPAKTPIPQLTNSFNKSVTSYILESGISEDEVVRVDSSLVNLNVSVFSKDLKTYTGLVDKNDFRIYEDGREQPISFFARTEMPFDLVLVLDLSGSTAGKVGLIRKSARKFIETKRPIDRLAIVTFADDTKIVSPLTEDRAKLLEDADKIGGSGGSYVWDALKFALGNVIEGKTNRRRAIVLMSDGADNALMYQSGLGSKTLFADLLETVRLLDTTIIPIYLDTEGDDALSHRVYRDARKTLSLLAKESGGTVYTARKIEDLNGVYEQVLNDLSKIYTLSYVPENEKRDGIWRTIKIEIPTRPDLIMRTKSGYYAK
ncbi:MAG TPA: VWA domain-containing protein [Pyrinomonadaceae bacterium]|nr:VWA domain-containing protein [Pyrinomonadaceae bacterium]